MLHMSVFCPCGGCGKVPTGDSLAAHQVQLRPVGLLWFFCGCLLVIFFYLNINQHLVVIDTNNTNNQ